MSGPLLFCAVAAFLGWVLAQGAARFALARKLRCATVQRVSYGGVARACVPVGGVILVVAVACFVIPVGVLGMLPLAGPVLFMTGTALGVASLSPGVRGGLLVLLLCVVPDAPGVGIGVVLAPVLKRHVVGADLVPGIPAALFAPALLGGGAFLVVMYGDLVGFLALIAGGALAGLQPFHGFPPRLTLGAGGVPAVAGVSGLLIWHFLQHGSGLALLLLWSFVWAELALRLWRRHASAIPPFELARLRGEPESGLTLASLSLSLAGVVLLLTVSRQPLAAQIVAIVALIVLQWQFWAFLTREETKHPRSAEPPGASTDI